MGSDPRRPQIVIAGAGAIGCFVGGMLAVAGADVGFFGRRRVLDEVTSHGLRLTDYDGLDISVAAGTLDLRQSPAILERADLILVCVKSGATAALAAQIKAHARPDATIVSLQNGMGNVDDLRAALPDFDVRAGMVPFNVVPIGEGAFHRATSGDIVIGAGPGCVARALSVPGLPVTESAEIEAIQWGKFLLNLNNAPNALSGLTLHAQLMDRSWRCVMADQIAEALRVLRANDRPIKSTTPVPVWLLPYVLRLPTPLFKRVAAKMLTIDRAARTSMAHDLAQGRKTEVDALQGKVVDMGAQIGIATPLSLSLLRAVRAAEGRPPRAHGVTEVRP